MTKRRVITAREQQEMLSPWRTAMPLTRIPPMSHFNADLFHKQMRQLVYSDQEIAGIPERANTIRCQGGSCTNTAGKPAVVMSFIHHDEKGAPTGILHYFPEGSRGAREKPGGIQVLVHPDHQGKGVGSKLLADAMAKYGPEGSEGLRWWAPIDLDNQQVTPGGSGLVQKYKNRTAAAGPEGLTGININDDYQDYTGQILRGEKTIETRNTKSLHHAVGQTVGLISTRRRPYRPAMVVGIATIGEPIFYPDEESFNADYDRHQVGRDSPHHISSPDNPTGTKYGYPMHDVKAIEPLPAPPGGRVTRLDMQFPPRGAL